MRDKVISKLWTNNNAESINNRLKEVVDWKQHSLPDLTDKIKTVSNIQFNNLRRAMYDRGDYIIISNMSTYIIDEDIWFQKTPEEKTDRFVKFLNAKIPAENSSYIFASSVNLNCKRPRNNDVNVGKKPGQRKRQKVEGAADFKPQNEVYSNLFKSLVEGHDPPPPRRGGLTTGGLGVNGAKSCILAISWH